jgi:colanic acid biosynthesis glycosyl transferase WcaI
MRILYVAQNYLPEMGAGPGRISEMARAWVARGHEVEVLAPVPNHPTGVVPLEFRGLKLFRETDAFGVEATRTWIYAAANRGVIRRSIAFSSFAVASVFTGLLATRRPDIIIGSSPQLLAAVGGFAIANARRVPWVFEVRDLWPEGLTAVNALSPEHPVMTALHALADLLYNNSTRVVVVTQGQREALVSRGIPAEKIAFIPNGVDLGKFVPAAANPADRSFLGGSADRIVTYMGTHGMSHDLDRLVEIAARLRGRRDIAFAFVGDGAERPRLEAVAKHARLENVRFLGIQPRDRMPALYAASDLCVVPLRKTELFLGTLPSKIFEIMGMGKPLALAVDGEARRLVETAGAGRFVPPGDTDALEAAILDLVKDPAELQAMGARGREYVAREFDRSVLAARYLEVLEEAVREGR